MYCMHCGKQIPDNAMYCSHCGVVVVKNPQQPPAYTPPVSQQPPAYTPPAPQQPPVYTPPVKPLEEVYGYVPPVQEPAKEPVYAPPVREAPVYTAQATVSEEPAVQPVQPPYTPVAVDVPEKKRIRKLPILLGMLAVVLVILLATMLGGNSGGNKPKTADTRKTFGFTEEKFIDQYKQVIRDNDLNYTLAEYPIGSGENLFAYEILNNKTNVGYCWVRTDPETDKVVMVLASTKSTTQPGPLRAVHCVVDASCGKRTQEEQQRYDEMIRETDRGSKGRIELDGAVVTLDKTTGFAVEVAIPGYETSMDSNGASASDQRAAGKSNIENGLFLFDYNFVGDTLKTAWKNAGLSIVASKPDKSSKLSDGGYATHYTIGNEKDPDMGWVTVYSDKNNEKVEWMLFMLEENLRKSDELPKLMEVLIRTSHGAMTDAMFEEFVATQQIEEGVSSKGNPYTLYTYSAFDLTVKINLGSSGMSVTVEPQQTEAGSQEGQLRFDSTGFLFGAEEFETYFRDGMELTELPFVLDKPAPVGDNKYNYHVLYSGKQVGYLIFTFDPATGKAVDISLTYNYQSNEKVDEYGTYAAIAMIPICHGAVTDEQFDALGATEPTVNREDYILYDYRLDGMRTMLVFEPDQIFVNVTIP